MHVACNLSIVVKKWRSSQGHRQSFTPKVVVSWKWSLIKRLKQKSTNRKLCAVRPFNSSNCDDLGCMSRSFIDWKFFSILTSALRCPSAIAELLVLYNLHRIGWWLLQQCKHDQLQCDASSLVEWTVEPDPSWPTGKSTSAVTTCQLH